MNPAAFAAPPASACVATNPPGGLGPDRIARHAYDVAGRATSITAGFGTAQSRTESITYTPGSRP